MTTITLMMFLWGVYTGYIKHRYNIPLPVAFIILFSVPLAIYHLAKIAI